ncbi:MAG: PHP domain-containing protein, partial [Deltaproteobacteria bacterium]|nr:PHP domain-containing protein [Deltaproteobacteria bacterium]
MPFVHLHNHTEYSLLNGAIRIPDLVAKTRAFGMQAVAMTDYANIFGAVDFFSEAQKKGIKPIIGCTVFLPSHDQHTLKQHRRGIDHLWQVVLLILDKQGYKNLCRLLTVSCLEGFYYKPRVDMALLKEYNGGLICLSGGWGSPVNHALFEG